MADFATEASNIGAGIGGFLNPIIGGNTKTTVTEAPIAPTSNNNNITIAIVVVVLVVVGYFLIKPKKAA